MNKVWRCIVTAMGLDRADSRPPFTQIAEALRVEIATGKLTAGAMLPSTRKLAEAWGVAPGTVRAAIEVLRAEKLVTGWRGKGVVVCDLLGPVPQGFPATALEADWLTAYQFTHGGQTMHHADIAHVTAMSVWEVRARNHPPEPSTEGRERPFRNEIEARLASRHLIGQWKNTSDTRYFGTLHLAVLPGETVMEGYYTGLASDISVSMGPWRWVRVEGEGAAAVTLPAPAALHALVMGRPVDAGPLALDEITEAS